MVRLFARDFIWICSFVLDKLCNHVTREQDEIWTKKFSGVLPHDLHWETKTYKLKRFIISVQNDKATVTVFIFVVANEPVSCRPAQ